MILDSLVKTEMDLNDLLKTVCGFETLPVIPVTRKNKRGFLVDFENSVVVYSDGCYYSDNSTKLEIPASAGFGVWFGTKHPL